MGSNKGEAPLPRNVHAEHAYLGYALVGGKWRDDISAHDFGGEREQAVFNAMAAIHTAGDAIDLNRLALELGERKLRQVGVGFLAELREGHFPEMNINPYIAKLREATGRRDVVHHCNVLMSHALSGDRGAEELISMGTDAFAGLQRGRNGHEPPPTTPSWPDPIHEDGFHGVVGALAHAMEPYTEADPAALLIECHVGFGSLVGRGPYYLAEAARHHTNEYVVIVGLSSKSRKGTSWGRILSVLSIIDPHWVENCQLGGLGSGEALIDAFNGEDKRVLVEEEEFARLLAVISREGSTLSHNLRRGWDKGDLSINTRQNKLKVNGAHLSVIGHITRDELLRRLDSTETANGFGNRHLWVCAKRSKVLPHGGGDMAIDGGILRRLNEATEFARKIGNTRVKFDYAASQLWEHVYPSLSEGQPGMLGSMTSRAEAHVVRLSLIYALLDCAGEICEEHLKAALEIWRYCDDSARYIWGAALGDPTADEILRALRAAGGNGLTQWDLNNHFSRRKPSAELCRALGALTERGLIRFETEQTGGRAATRYFVL